MRSEKQFPISDDGKYGEDADDDDHHHHFDESETGRAP
jgi:hypothetical protein